jgi:rhodanese-related sulfurtransferase/rubrerythrin
MMILESFYQRVKSIPPQEVRKIIKEKSASDYCLLDVRQPSEYEQGHLPGAKLIPLPELEPKIDTLKPNKMTIVYCRSGNRSRSAVGMLNGAGMDDVYNMEGGILAYNGLVAAGPPEAGVFCFPENMSPEQLIAMAWYIEDGSKSYVGTIKEMSQNMDVKDILTILYEHKVAHKKTLENLYEKLSGESIKDGFPAYVLKKPPKIVMSGCVNVPDAVHWSKDKDASEILDFMMALEANTFDLYLKLGREVKSERARSVFMQLSEEEAGHLDKLSSVFEKTL